MDVIGLKHTDACLRCRDGLHEAAQAQDRSVDGCRELGSRPIMDVIGLKHPAAGLR